MSTRLRPIRIGDTFRRDYTFKDGANVPIPLAGIGITFNFKVGSKLFTYGPGTGVTVNLSTSKVSVLLTPEQTATLSRSVEAQSYVEFDYGNGQTKSKAQQAEVIVPKQATG